MISNGKIVFLLQSCTLSLLKRITSSDVRQLSIMAKRIAVCQMTSVADKAANMSVVSQLVSDAAKEDVQV